MAIRVTNREAAGNFVRLLIEQRYNLEKARERVSTGIEVVNPSDDAGRSGSIVAFQGVIQRIDRHQERISFAQNLLDFQENVANSASDLIVRAKELATQAANDTLTQEARSLIADEVFQLRDQMVSLGNSTYQGLYIYGAADDDDAPFDSAQYTQAPLDPTQPADRRFFYDAEAGTAVTRSVQISDSETVRVVTPGDQIFSGAIAGLERLGRALEGYRTGLDVTSGLPDGTGTAFTLPLEEPAQQDAILRALDALEVARSTDLGAEITSLGSRSARLTQVSAVLESLKINTDAARASIQDADPFASASQYANLQSSLQALLASGAQINNLSLLNYL